MKIGNIEFNVESVSRLTREEFIEKFSGRLNTDINAAAEKLSSYFKQEEVVGEVVQVDLEDSIGDVKEAGKKSYSKKRRRK